MKKIIVYLLMVLMIMQSVQIVNAQNTFAEAVYTDLSKEVQLLNLLGINIETESDYINRGEFAVLVTKLMGNRATESSEKSSFSDISEYYVYIDEINFVKSQGLMTGYGDKFEPVKPVTLQEALKVFVILAGYQEIAEAKGGYPSGYISVANTLKLTRGVNCSYVEAFGSTAAYKLAFNLLKTPLFEISSISTDNTIHYETSTDTYGKEYFGISEISGRIVATSVSALLGYDLAPEGQITIGNKSYYALPSINEYLGQNIDAYIRETESDCYEVIYCEASNNNKIVRINKDDILSVIGFDSSDAVQYKRNPKLEYSNENGGMRSLTLGGNLQVAYNGVITTNIRNADFTDNYGYIDVIDTDNNGTSDFVSITSYVDYVVDRVDTANNRLVFKNGGEFILDDQKIVSIVHENRILNFNDILKDSIISVRTSKLGAGENISDSSVFYADISMEIIEGNISELSTDNNEVLINDVLYEYNESIESDMLLGVPYKFYLDAFSRVCFAEKVYTSEGNYYFFVNSGMTKKLNGKFQMQFVNMNEEVVVFTMPEKIVYTGPNKNGEWIDRKSLDQKKIVEIFDANFTGRHLFKLVLSDEGELEQLIAPYDGTASTDYAGYSKEFSLDRVSTSIAAHNQCIDKVYRYEANIPLIINNIAGGAEDIIVTKTTTKVSVRNLVNVQVYDSSDSLYAGLIVANINETTGGTTSSNWVRSWETAIFVLDKIAYARNKDDYFVPMISGWENGAYVSYSCVDENVKDMYSDSPFKSFGYKTELKDLTRGDLIMLSKNNSNEIDGFMSVFTFTGTSIPTDYRETFTDGATDWGATFVTYYDKVYKCYDKTFRLTNDTEKIIPLSAHIYMYDMPNNEVKKLSLEEAYGLLKDNSYSTPDYVFVRQRRSQQVEMIIYRR